MFSLNSPNTSIWISVPRLTILFSQSLFALGHDPEKGGDHAKKGETELNLGPHQSSSMCDIYYCSDTVKGDNLETEE